MRPNPRDEEAPKKAYASLQASDYFDMEKLCEHIAHHGSIWTPDLVLGVVRKLVSCMEELLVQGNTIELGNLGSFCVKCKSTGAIDPDSFTVANITKVYPVWSRGKIFKNLKESKLGMKFERVLTKKAIEEMKK